MNVDKDYELDDLSKKVKDFNERIMLSFEIRYKKLLDGENIMTRKLGLESAHKFLTKCYTLSKEHIQNRRDFNSRAFNVKCVYALELSESFFKPVTNLENVSDPRMRNFLEEHSYMDFKDLDREDFEKLTDGISDILFSEVKNKLEKGFDSFQNLLYLNL